MLIREHLERAVCTADIFAEVSISVEYAVDYSRLSNGTSGPNDRETR